MKFSGKFLSFFCELAGDSRYYYSKLLCVRKSRIKIKHFFVKLNCSVHQRHTTTTTLHEPTMDDDVIILLSDDEESKETVSIYTEIRWRQIVSNFVVVDL